MRRFVVASLIALGILGLTPRTCAAPPIRKHPPEVAKKEDQFDIWVRLGRAMAMQDERESLKTALQLLHAIPIQDAYSAGPEGEVDYKLRRRDALRALQAFNALDEYKRKVKAYYKGDMANATYDELMAEVLGLDHPKAAIPFLEAAHRADPNSILVVTDLVSLYAGEGRDQDIFALVDPLLALGAHIRGGLQIDIVALYARMNQLPRLAQLEAAILKPSSGDGLGSYVDTTVDLSHHSDYRIAAMIDRTFGYPAREVPPPDRLGTFLP